MRKLKKLCLFLLSVATAACALTACQFRQSPNENSFSSEISGSISETDSSETNGSTSDSEHSGNSGEDSASEESSGSSEEDYPPEYFYAEDIMNEAELLAAGESLVGTYELSGVITYVDVEYTSSKGICLYFDVDEPQKREMYCYQLKGAGASLIGAGDHITVSGSIKNYKGLLEFDKGCTLIAYEISEENVPPDLEDDPYANVSESEFYANYSPALSNEDAYYRSLHGFMSGTLETPDQEPETSAYQPMKGGKYIRNNEMQLSEDGKTYTVVDAYGNEAFNVYRDGAYITLEEVAAFVYAFGTYPANYTISKDIDPSDSVWGEYLRLNHTAFSGDTSRYPYEPILPNISGCGGDLNYYEMDIGTTGTDCDPSYEAKLYNDGNTITRGAARIVYGKRDLDGDGVYEIGEFHVFYTYNHYNDFQEYLNYEGGWGEMFGNITGGGTISSKTDYNPTDYVDVCFEPLSESSKTLTSSAYYYYDNKKFLGTIAYPEFYIV